MSGCKVTFGLSLNRFTKITGDVNYKRIIINVNKIIKYKVE